MLINHQNPYLSLSLHTSKSDEIIGFDVDVAKYIGKELGYEVKVKDMDFGDHIFRNKINICKINIIFTLCSWRHACHYEINFS
jgi:ABC-type amino acid transport substrate-binding protein